MKMKSITTVLVVYATVIGLACGGALIARNSQAHDRNAAHNLSQTFYSHYDAQYDVYCGWRHAFEGISCVKLGD